MLWGPPGVGKSQGIREVAKDIETETGKKVALFGSYGWGDGEWMRDWQDRVNKAGENLVNGEGLIINDMPDNDGLNQCRNLGKTAASA